MIKGPFTRTASNSLLYKETTWYTQSKPRIHRLPFTMRVAFTKKVVGGLNQPASAFPPYYFGSVNPAMGKCYDKFKAALGEASQSAVNYAEREEALKMISARAGQILASARRIRHGDFKGLFPKEAFLKKGRYSGRKTSKALGDTWLEYHFGWDPLIKDIGACVDILQSGCPPVTVKSRASCSNVTLYRNPGQYWTLWTNTYTAKVQMISEVSVSDPNLWLANQLGFVNPLVIAWELVPFSFVVDWFTNVGSFLSQYSDFFGLNLKDPATTTLESVIRQYTDYRPTYCDITCVEMTRTQGISKPPLLIKPRKRLSIVRAATAVALLVGFLK